MPAITGKKRIKTQPRRRLGADERRRLIIEAAIPLFSESGFRGVTTKEIARRAGVSEALLYQHFPSKEALYSEVQDRFCTPSPGLKAAVDALRPSTESLVLLLYYIANSTVKAFGDKGRIYPRLLIASLAEDGSFARLHSARMVDRVVGFMRDCFVAARATGDLEADGMTDEMRFWLCHHTAVTLGTYLMHEPPIVTYPVGGDALAVQLHRFMLRGAGLNEAAVRRYCDYQRLAGVVAGWLAEKETLN